MFINVLNIISYFPLKVKTPRTNSFILFLIPYKLSFGLLPIKGSVSSNPIGLKNSIPYKNNMLFASLIANRDQIINIRHKSFILNQ